MWLKHPSFKVQVPVWWNLASFFLKFSCLVELDYQGEMGGLSLYGKIEIVERGA